MVCKKQEQCKFGKMCGWAKDEETLLTECVEFIERVPQTNEEWLKSCNTEQLAEAIYNFVWCSNELWQQLCCNGDGTDEESDLKIVREWLKQPHKPIS